MNNLIGLTAIETGKGSGKDEVCRIIQKLVPDSNYQNKKFAGKLKEIASILTGVTDWEDRDRRDEVIPQFQMTRRRFLQILGTEGIRNVIHKDAWVSAMFSDYKIPPAETKWFKPEHQNYPNWIITDVRFENEVQAIRDRGGIIVDIKRRGLTKDDSHKSENAINHIVPDYQILNMAGIPSLEEQVKEFINYYS